MIPVSAPVVPMAVASPALAEPAVAASFNDSDLARLRELIQSTASQTANPGGAPPVADAAEGVAPSFGDSILAGMMRFGNNYQSSMRAIETRLQEVVANESAGLSSFSEILALQVDVSKWSMSVMGVDNASKAGANTIKELSRGG
jgi:hypothetical protein